MQKLLNLHPCLLEEVTGDMVDEEEEALCERKATRVRDGTRLAAQDISRTSYNQDQGGTEKHGAQGCPCRAKTR